MIVKDQNAHTIAKCIFSYLQEEFYDIQELKPQDIDLDVTILTNQQVVWL